MLARIRIIAALCCAACSGGGGLVQAPNTLAPPGDTAQNAPVDGISVGLVLTGTSQESM